VVRGQNKEKISEIKQCVTFIITEQDGEHVFTLLFAAPFPT
jgi:hypothetical protein